MARTTLDGPDLGDLVLVLLAGSLAGLRDRLEGDGFPDAASLVADLVEMADDYLLRGERWPGRAPSGSVRGPDKTTG